MPHAHKHAQMTPASLARSLDTTDRVQTAHSMPKYTEKRKPGKRPLMIFASVRRGPRSCNRWANQDAHTRVSSPRHTYSQRMADPRPTVRPSRGRPVGRGLAARAALSGATNAGSTGKAKWRHALLRFLCLPHAYKHVLITTSKPTALHSLKLRYTEQRTQNVQVHLKTKSRQKATLVFCTCESRPPFLQPMGKSKHTCTRELTRHP